ncbi:MAG: hypothetical protein ACRC80_37180, partial [Waterburya sp.]
KLRKIMNQDALERLRNRVKPTVESRDLSPIPSVNNHQDLGKDEASLTFNTQKNISNSSNQDISISTSENRGRRSSASPAVERQGTLDLEKLSSSSKSVSDELDSSSMDIETKQSTVRLEKKLSQRLTQQCQSEEISREVFLEALFVYFENHKSMQSKVLQEARKRDGQRQKLANYRRAKSMIERFSGT